MANNNGQDVYVQTTGLELKVPEALRTKLAPPSGRAIVFGVRPEHLRSRTEVREARPGQTATVDVSVVEPLGSEVFAYLSANGHEFIARMDATAQPRPGESIETFFDTDHLHVFDKQTEPALG